MDQSTRSQIAKALLSAASKLEATRALSGPSTPFAVPTGVEKEKGGLAKFFGLGKKEPPKQKTIEDLFKEFAKMLQQISEQRRRHGVLAFVAEDALTGNLERTIPSILANINKGAKYKPYSMESMLAEGIEDVDSVLNIRFDVNKQFYEGMLKKIRRELERLQKKYKES